MLTFDRGDVGSLEKVLSKSMVTWQGIVKNIEYLSLDDSIKRVMGKWWRTWVKTDVGRQSHSQSQPQADSQHQLPPHSARRAGNARIKRESSDVESDIEDTEEDEDEEDGMQVDVPDNEHASGVEKDDGGVSQLLKNL